ELGVMSSDGNKIEQLRRRARAWRRAVSRPEALRHGGRLRRWFMRNTQVVMLVARWEVVDRLQLHAQALTYDSLLAMVPLLAVVFAVVGSFAGFAGLRGQLENWVIDNLAGSPEVQAAVANHIHGFVGNIEAGSMSAISVVMLLFSVMSLLGHIETSFNQI